MRITKKVFVDLAIYMISLGVIVGVAFPFFCILIGVPRELAMRPFFRAACVLAGIVLGALNIVLARRIVGYRVNRLSQKMKHVEDILVARQTDGADQECNAESCLIEVDSEDELGDSARSFNQLVMTLSEVLATQTEVQLFSEMLASNLEVDVLADHALQRLVANLGASGGAILLEQGGDLKVVASLAIADSKVLAANARIIHTVNSMERQLVHFPSEIALDGVIASFRPKELLIEPIVYKHVLLGVLVLASGSGFPGNAIDKITMFNPPLAMAFRNAITHGQMQQLAALDPLTGVYNRRFGNRRIQEELSRSVRSGTPLSLLILDIDHFKAVNDTYGHMSGDKVLVMVAQTVLGAIREGDVLVRYGGEEFLCVLPGASKHDVAMVAERIRVMVNNAVLKNVDQELRVTVSVGTVSYPSDSIADVQQFIRLADEAMYEAKRTGRNRVVSL